MKKAWIRLLSLALCLMISLNYPILAADTAALPDAMGGEMGTPPDAMGGGEMGTPPDGMGGGGDAAASGDAAPASAAIVITDGAEDTAAEYEAGAYSGLITGEDGILVLDGLELSSDLYTYNGLVVTGADSVVRLQKATIRLGVGADATDDDTGGAAVNIDNGATVYISDSELVVDGAARYVTANYNDGTLIVNNSTVTSTGSNEYTAQVSEPFSNEALLISGTARANFSIGASKTYYFDSVCTAEGWAALSTDSATGDGLDLYAYNTEGIAENGGYATYADTNCRVWLYGSRLTAAEIGCIISKSGQIVSMSSDAADESIMVYHEGTPVSVDSSIVGGRNAVMIHAPDMMGEGLSAADCGTFTAENTLLATDSDLQSTKDYSDYSEAIAEYVDYVSGDIFLIRSTSASISLKNVEMESYNGVLLHTVLNSDSMGNFLAAGDGDQVDPVALTMEDMEVSGDILHEDYQRRMTVDLENTTLNGCIVSGTMESWNSRWSDYGEVNWVVDESFDVVYGVSLTVGSGSVWNVTGESSLTSLTVAEGGTVNGDITLDGDPLTPEPGKTYTGEILVSGSYVPEEAEDEDSVQSTQEESTASSAEEPSAAATEAAQETTAQETAPSASPAAGDSGLSGGAIAGIAIAIVVIVAAVVIAVVVRKKKQQ